MSWETSRRRDGLPSYWPRTIRRILARDPKCRCGGCRRCGTMGEGGPCMRTSMEVDHIVPGDDHRDVNLRGICRPCHAVKSSQEGNAAQAERKKPTGFFTEPRPGRL